MTADNNQIEASRTGDSYSCVAVAFLQATGGEISVLMCVDCGDEPLYDGEPVVIVSHRPFGENVSLSVEAAECVDPQITQAIEANPEEFIRLISNSFENDGSFNGELLLSKTVNIGVIKR